MKKIAFLFLLLTGSLGLTGCFEVLEEVTLAGDGTGHVKFTVNLSESKSTLANYLDMGEFDGYNIPSQKDIERDLQRIRTTLQQVPGLSAVEVNSNMTDFIFVIKSRFSNVQSLNTAINAVADALNKTPFQTMELDNFDYTGTAFRRYFNYPVSLVDFETLPQMYKYVLDTGRMISIYHFDRRVRTCTNDKAEISPSKQSVKLETTVGQMIRGERTIANSVLLLAD